MNNSYSIQDIPEEERPRERLLRHGAESLTHVELLAILLGSGTKATPVLQLAQQLISSFGSMHGIGEATISELCSIKGLGQAKALQLKAAINLGLRAARKALPIKYRIDIPLHAYNLVREELESEKRELLIIILKDIKNFVITHHVVSIGTLTQTLVHPREIFNPAIRHNASSLILAHNHPSGDTTPSKEDLEMTNQLIEAGKLIGIPVHDHLIIGHQNYLSLRKYGVNFPN